MQSEISSKILISEIGRTHKFSYQIWKNHILYNIYQY